MPREYIKKYPGAFDVVLDASLYAGEGKWAKLKSIEMDEDNLSTKL
jgi:hypothetical protein